MVSSFLSLSRQLVHHTVIRIKQEEGRENKHECDIHIDFRTIKISFICYGRKTVMNITLSEWAKKHVEASSNMKKT